MAGVVLQEAGQAIVYRSVPWAKGIYSMKKASFPKGSVPKHLTGYLFKKGGVPATCAAQTKGMAGARRVRAMNACVSAQLGRKG